MSLRPKTRRRMMIVAITALMAILLLGGFIVVRRGQVKAETAAYRSEGIAAYEQEDWPGTIESLGKYIGRQKGDAEAHYYFADARRHLPLKQAAHLVEAIRHLQAALNVRPDYIEAQDLQLKLLSAVRLHNETLELTDTILARDPKNVDALRARAMALAGLRRFEDAQATLADLFAVDADNFAGRVLELQIMRAMETDPQQIIDHAAALREKHAGDPAYEALQVQAYLLVGRRDEAMPHLSAAVAGKPTDEQVAGMLINLCDSVGQFDSSIAVLRGVVAASDKQEHRTSLAQRLFEIRRVDEAIPYLPQTPLDQQLTDVLALRAMCLLDAGRADDAAPVLGELQKRADELEETPLAGNAIDYAPDIWVPLLAKWDDDADSPMPELIPIAQSGIERQPGNVYFQHMLARSYASVGESQLAIKTWAQLIPQRRSWVVPYVELSRQLLGRGGAREAMATAKFAYGMAPQWPEAQIAYLAARSAVLPINADDSPEQLLADVDKFLADHPDNTLALAIKVQTLVRLERKADAADAIRMALVRVEDEPTLLQLAAISEANDLGVKPDCLDRIKRVHGNTPMLALQQALVRRAEEKMTAEQVLAAFDQQMTASDHPDQFEWLLARARLMDALGNAQAVDAWRKLFDQHADDLRAARAVMQSRVAWSDRELIDRAIGKMREATGDRGVTWRMAKARWILRGQYQESELAACNVMLSDLIGLMPNAVEPRLLKARCLQLLGETNSAREQLELSVNLQPNNPGLKIDLARLQIETGDRNQATQTLIDVVGAARRLTPEQRSSVASMFMQLGESDRVIELITQVDPSERLTGEDLLLAQAYLGQGKLDEAEPIINRLYDKSADPLTIQLSAELLARQGKTEQAKARIAELNNVNADEALKNLLNAEFAQRYADPTESHDFLLQAAKASPKSPLVWAKLLAYELRADLVDEALAHAAEAKEQLVAPSQGILALVDKAQIIRQFATDPMRRSLAASLVESPGNADAAMALIELLHNAEQNEQPIDAFLAALQQYVDQHSGYLQGQLLTAEIFARTGRMADAAALALRATEAFPDAVAPARMAAQILAASGRFDEAIGMARRWRDRSPTQTLPADQFIAEVSLRLNQPRQAIEVLQPYVDDLVADPETNARAVALQASALARVGQYDQVEKMFDPLLARNPGWKKAWIDLATRQVADQTVAARWLDKVRPTIAKEDLRNRLALTDAYFAIGRRTDRQDLIGMSESLLLKLADDFPESGDVTLMQAIRYELAGDRDKAAAAYRRTLELVPNQPVASNNLAMTIVDRGGDLDEAARLVDAIIEQSPNVAAFHDTAAQVAAKKGDLPTAIEHLQTATSLEPQSLEWQVNLAEVMVQADRADEARQIVEGMEGIDLDDRRLTPAVREKLQSLRDRFGEELVTPAP